VGTGYNGGDAMSIADFWGTTEKQRHRENLFTAGDAEER
jgi:NAD(P)H-hydrate repair Nnr-like enzyme with NAD(P)H-hydrate epimerase domain